MSAIASASGAFHATIWNPCGAIGSTGSAASSFVQPAQRTSSASRPAPSSTNSTHGAASTATPKAAAASAIGIGPRMAGRRSRHAASATSTTMAGRMPVRKSSTRGVVPHSKYAHDRTPTMMAAGTMNAKPESSPPAMPLRRWPRWIAISVEFGPGTRFVAASARENDSLDSQLRRRTYSSSIIAMCATGPPKASTPSRRNVLRTSKNDPRAPEGSSFMPAAPPARGAAASVLHRGLHRRGSRRQRASARACG